jgi:NTP pyrophosphatase (non-canonical NTP hydrolase)
MDFKDYQIQAYKTAIYPKQIKIVYPAMGLAGEAGEVANKIKKLMRDDNLGLTTDQVDRQKAEEAADELGDVMWYVAVLAQDLGFGLEDIVQKNLAKLKSRKERGTLHGSGDNR